MVSSADEMAIVMTAVLMKSLQYGYGNKTQDEATECAAVFGLSRLH